MTPKKACGHHAPYATTYGQDNVLRDEAIASIQLELIC